MGTRFFDFFAYDNWSLAGAC
jgi:hypothetical protein